MIKFGKAVEAVLGEEMTDGRMAVHSAAHECDRLRTQLIEASRCMAERFARYAVELEAGHNTSSPMGYSTLRDIPTDEGRYAAKVEELWNLLRIVCGTDAVKAVREALKSAR